MTSHRAFALALLFVAPAPLLYGQFGRILGRAKEKIDQTREKAKPVTDRTERAVDTFQPWSAAEEQQVGEAAAERMIVIFGLVDDPKLVRYVNLVGQTVAQFAPRQLPYRFGVLNTEIVGAFALPGGFVFITRAALEGMANEAQLAGALGHEIVHVAERHLEREVRSKATTNWAVEETRARTGTLLQDRADALVKDLFNMRLSRDKEARADEEGCLLAAKAGYAANGLLEFLTVMTEQNTKEENKRAFGQLLSTHPPFEDRIQQLTPVVERQPGGKTVEARFRAAMSAGAGPPAAPQQ